LHGAALGWAAAQSTGPVVGTGWVGVAGIAGAISIAVRLVFIGKAGAVVPHIGDTIAIAVVGDAQALPATKALFARRIIAAFRCLGGLLPAALISAPQGGGTVPIHIATLALAGGGAEIEIVVVAVVTGLVAGLALRFVQAHHAITTNGAHAVCPAAIVIHLVTVVAVLKALRTQAEIPTGDAVAAAG